MAKQSNWAWIAGACWLAAACSPEPRQVGSAALHDAPAVGNPAPQPSAAEPLHRPAGKRCVVLLHGKGGTAQPGRVTEGTTFIQPGGNADGWGGRQWLYFPEARYQQVRAIVQSAIDDAGCGPVIVQGFSNGAATAAKLYCRGERFGQHVIGYIADDPVPDHGVDACKPAPGVRMRVYWTGALASATDGWSCAQLDWTCEGDSTIGIERYARALATQVQRSIHTTHAEYAAPPEQTAWFDR
jgi:hypothetical protein